MAPLYSLCCCKCTSTPSFCQYPLWLCLFYFLHIVQCNGVLIEFAIMDFSLILVTEVRNPIPLSICTWFLQFSSLNYRVQWTGFFPKFELNFSASKIQVWNIKLAKSKIPVRVVKNVLSKWTKMEFPRFLSLWFKAGAGKEYFFEV